MDQRCVWRNENDCTVTLTDGGLVVTVTTGSIVSVSGRCVLVRSPESSSLYSQWIVFNLGGSKVYSCIPVTVLTKGVRVEGATLFFSSSLGVVGSGGFLGY